MMITKWTVYTAYALTAVFLIDSLLFNFGARWTLFLNHRPNDWLYAAGIMFLIWGVFGDD